jgi:nucleoid DNA-binding protein
MQESRAMTKADIVEQIYEQVGFSKKESAELVEKSSMRSRRRSPTARR